MLVFPTEPMLIFRRPPLAGHEKSQFSTNISLYLGNDTIYSHSFYGTPQIVRLLQLKIKMFQLRGSSFVVPHTEDVFVLSLVSFVCFAP